MHNICSLIETIEENSGRFQGFGQRFGSSEKDCYFLKILKWQHKLARDCKQGKLVSYFLNNAAKTYLHGIKISENIEVEHVFQSEAFFSSQWQSPHKLLERL